MKKLCRQCQSDIDISDFYRHPKTVDRLQAICKNCHKTNAKTNRTGKAEYYQAYEKSRATLPHRVEARRQYQKTPEGRAAASKAKLLYVERNPVKRAAHILCNNAMRDGRLIRLPCEVCGRAAQAHHDNYNKPLEVRWLCTTHHSEWHRHNKPIC